MELDKQIHRHIINWQWVKGHDGHQYNEKADYLARKYIKKKKKKNLQNLYFASYLFLFIPIYATLFLFIFIYVHFFYLLGVGGSGRAGRFGPPH